MTEWEDNLNSWCKESYKAHVMMTYCVLEHMSDGEKDDLITLSFPEIEYNFIKNNNTQIDTLCRGEVMSFNEVGGRFYKIKKQD